MRLLWLVNRRRERDHFFIRAFHIRLPDAVARR
jgi:hypothetical protein